MSIALFCVLVGKSMSAAPNTRCIPLLLWWALPLKVPRAVASQTDFKLWLKLQMGANVVPKITLFCSFQNNFRIGFAYEATLEAVLRQTLSLGVEQGDHFAQRQLQRVSAAAAFAVRGGDAGGNAQKRRRRRRRRRLRLTAAEVAAATTPAGGSLGCDPGRGGGSALAQAGGACEGPLQELVRVGEGRSKAASQVARCGRHLLWCLVGSSPNLTNCRNGPSRMFTNPQYFEGPLPGPIPSGSAVSGATAVGQWQQQHQQKQQKQQGDGCGGDSDCSSRGASAGTSGNRNGSVFKIISRRSGHFECGCVCVVRWCQISLFDILLSC